MLIGFARVGSAADREVERASLARAGVPADAMRFVEVPGAAGVASHGHGGVADAGVIHPGEAEDLGAADALAALLDELGPDDVVVVTRPGRLSDSQEALVAFAGELAACGAGIRVLDGALDSCTDEGASVLRALAVLDRFQRDLDF